VKKLLLILVPGLAFGCGKEPSESFRHVPGGLRNEISVNVTAAAFSPDGKFLLLGYNIIKGPNQGFPGDDEFLVLREVASGKKVRILHGHSRVVTSVFFLPDGQQALSASMDGTIKVWNVTNGREVRTIVPYEDGGEIRAALSKDGKQALSKGREKEGEKYFHRLKLWDVDSGTLIRAFEPFRRDLNSVALAPNGKLAVTGGYTRDYDNLHLWDVEAGKIIHTFNGGIGVTWPGMFSPDGKSFIFHKKKGENPESGSGLVMWDLAKSKEVQVLDGLWYGYRAACFTPDSKHILTTGGDWRLRFWETSTGKEVWSEYAPDIRAIALSPDGQLGFTASGSEGSIRLKLWDVNKGVFLRNLDPNSK